MKLTYWAITHRGRRADNQDAIALIDEVPQTEGEIFTATVSLGGQSRILAIADGVGSRPEGRWAARTVLESLITCEIEPNTSTRIMQAIQAANARLTDWGQFGRGPASTLAGVSVDETRAVFFHVGDSRIYRLDGPEIRLLTADHRSRTHGHSITRFLGGSPAHAMPSLSEITVEHGVAFLLSTDGFHAFLGPSDFLLLRDLEPTSALAALIDTALENGSDDNLSAILCRVHG